MFYSFASRDAGPLHATELDPACERYPDLLRVRIYWDGKCQGRFAPRRADIDPMDLVEALPRIMLADVLTDPLDFRYRLSGTAICNVLGQEMTGKSPRYLVPTA